MATCRSAVPRELISYRFRRLLVAMLLVLFAAPPGAHADAVAVRFPEGVSHGFVRLRGEDGTIIADGETTQRRRGRRITARLVFRFRDGSLYDETTVFTDQGQLRLVTQHVIQRGPAFPQATDLFITTATGTATVRYTEKGEEKVVSEHLDLPADLANGIVQTMLKNVAPGGAVPASFPYVAATPKPRLVKLEVSVAEPARFIAGRMRRSATHYVLKVNLGGIKGALAPLVGKQPPDSHIWIVGTDAPMIVRAQQPFFADGPLWTIELVAPQWASD